MSCAELEGLRGDVVFRQDIGDPPRRERARTQIGQILLDHFAKVRFVPNAVHIRNDHLPLVSLLPQADPGIVFLPAIHCEL